MIKRLMFVLFVMLASGQSLSAAQPATVIHGTPLYAEPFTDATQTGQLNPETAVTITKRKGGWYQIQTPDGNGWVRLTTLRLQGHKQPNGSGSSLNSLGGGNGLFSTGRASNSDVTAATGIRGLENESLNTSANRSPANQLLNRIAVPTAAARAFAQQGHLQPQPLTYPDKITVEPPPPAGEAQKSPAKAPDTTSDPDDF